MIIEATNGMLMKGEITNEDRHKLFNSLLKDLFDK